ncbi:MAG: Calx-beta domain-containing protein, partial [Pseudomonadota bacterium]
SSANDDDIFYDALDSRSYNTLTFAPGETQKTVSVFARSDTLDEVDEFFSLELFNLSANAEFAGGEAHLSATGVINDDDGAGVNRALFVSDPKIVETDSGTKLAVFEIVLSEPAPSAFTATYETVDGSAKAGEDYIARTGAVSFAAGQQSASVSVEVIGDSNIEPSEFFSLAVTPPSSPLTNSQAATGTAVVLDDDGSVGPVISISDGTALEDEYVQFTLSLSEAPIDAVTVQYRLVYDGSAGDQDIFYDIDDSRTYNTVTFAPGQTSTDIFVFIRSDNVDETDEFFSIELFDASANASLAGGENTLLATGVISDDDGAGNDIAMHVTNPVLVEGDDGSKFAVFEVILSEPLSESMVATYRTIDASAVAGED